MSWLWGKNVHQTSPWPNWFITFERINILWTTLLKIRLPAYFCKVCMYCIWLYKLICPHNSFIVYFCSSHQIRIYWRLTTRGGVLYEASQITCLCMEKMEWNDFWKSIFSQNPSKICYSFNKRLFQIRIRLTLSGMLNKQLFSLKPPRDFLWKYPHRMTKAVFFTTRRSRTIVFESWL